MYIIVLAGSPWENNDSFFRNSVMVLARPAELRKASALLVMGFSFPIFRLLVRLFVFTALTLAHSLLRKSKRRVAQPLGLDFRVADPSLVFEGSESLVFPLGEFYKSPLESGSTCLP